MRPVLTDLDCRAIVRARAEQIAGAVVQAAADDVAVVPRRGRRAAALRLSAVEGVRGAIIEREVRVRR